MDKKASLRILIPREPARVAALVEALEIEGHSVDVLPMLRISSIENSLAADYIAADLAIFVSVNAVQSIAAQLSAQNKNWPENIKVAVIGAATARACELAGIPVDYMPTLGSNSEALLKTLDEMPIKGKLVHIYRAQSGRQWLGDVLLARGADVRYMACYHREIDTAQQEQLSKLALTGWDYVLVPSVEVARAMDTSTAQAFNQRHCHLIVFSQRIAQFCQKKWPNAGVVTLSTPHESEILAIIQQRKGADL